jgi:hypothetical protein
VILAEYFEIDGLLNILPGMRRKINISTLWFSVTKEEEEQPIDTLSQWRTIATPPSLHER